MYAKASPVLDTVPKGNDGASVEGSACERAEVGAAVRRLARQVLPCCQ